MIYNFIAYTIGIPYCGVMQLRAILTIQFRIISRGVLIYPMLSTECPSAAMYISRST